MSEFRVFPLPFYSKSPFLTPQLQEPALGPQFPPSDHETLEPLGLTLARLAGHYGATPSNSPRSEPYGAKPAPPKPFQLAQTWNPEPAQAPASLPLIFSDTSGNYYLNSSGLAVWVRPSQYIFTLNGTLAHSGAKRQPNEPLWIQRSGMQEREWLVLFEGEKLYVPESYFHRVHKVRVD